MSCECVRCKTCDGSGDVYSNFRFEYIGRGCVDDFVDIVSCPYCDGRAIMEVCQECAEAQED